MDSFYLLNEHLRQCGCYYCHIFLVYYCYLSFWWSIWIQPTSMCNSTFAFYKSFTIWMFSKKYCISNVIFFVLIVFLFSFTKSGFLFFILFFREYSVFYIFKKFLLYCCYKSFFFFVILIYFVHIKNESNNNILGIILFPIFIMITFY